jgi:heme A synthase
VKIIGFILGWLLRRIDRSDRFALWFPLSLVIVCVIAGASLGVVYGNDHRPTVILLGVFGGAFLGIAFVLLLLILSARLAKYESKQPETIVAESAPLVD